VRAGLEISEATGRDSASPAGAEPPPVNSGPWRGGPGSRLGRSSAGDEEAGLVGDDDELASVANIELGHRPVDVRLGCTRTTSPLRRTPMATHDRVSKNVNPIQATVLRGWGLGISLRRLSR
jgi:hypothetical protein